MIFSTQTRIAALFAFLIGPTALAQSTESNTPNGVELAAESPVDTVSLRIDFEERPEDEGGNLFLIGFKEVDDNNMPIAGSQPDDFQQIGVWVRTWPFEKEISVVRGLYYMALYGYSEYPSDADLTSKAVQHNEFDGGVLQLIVSQETRSPKQNNTNVP